MRRQEMIRATYLGAVCLCIAVVATSCSDGSGKNNGYNDGGGRVVQTSTVPTSEERFEAEFKRVLGDVRAKVKDVSKLNVDISQLPNQQDALQVYDRLFELAIAYPVPAKSYNDRLNQYYKLWFTALYSFLGVQRRQGGDFAYWDKLFRFFDKYTDEIAKVEKSLPATESRFWGRSNWERGRYLLNIREDFKQLVRVTRDFYFPELSVSLTDEQKADILRRFDGLKKYMDTPPNFPGGERGMRLP